MTQDQIQAIHNIIADQAGMFVENISPSMTFDELYLDSLDYVEIIMGVEDALNIRIDDEQLPQTPGMTVEQFVAGVARQCA